MHAVSSAGHQQRFLSFYLLTCTEEHLLQDWGWPVSTACECHWVSAASLHSQGLQQWEEWSLFFHSLGQVKKRIVTFEMVRAVQLSSSSCSPPTLCEESQCSRFYSMKRLFTTWLCLLHLCTFKRFFFFSVKAKKNCLVSFCLLSKRSASTYSMICSTLPLPVFLPSVPFSYPTCTAFPCKTFSLSEVPFKWVHQITPNLSDIPHHCETESPFLFLQ